MKKITRKQRLDALKNGFYRYGNFTTDNIDECVHSAWLRDQLTETFAKTVRDHNTYLSIAEIRSKDFIDSEGCFYDFVGKTYQYEDFLVHVYPFKDREGGTVSVLLVA